MSADAGIDLRAFAASVTADAEQLEYRLQTLAADMAFLRRYGQPVQVPPVIAAAITAMAAGSRP